jgi:uncharacterized membrane protein
MKKDRRELMKAERRKMLLEKKKRRNKQIFVTSIIAIAFIGIIAYFAMSSGNVVETKKDFSDQSTIIQTDAEIKIPLSEIDETADFYTYKSNGGVDIKYFTVKGSDGKPRVALDACDVCYHAKKGYTQVGDIMQCINCGLEFSISGIGTENIKGGCWPSFLPKTENGDYLILNISDLLAKQFMFT